MVMPLGPDFAEALAIPTSQIGLIGGVYTASAAVAGILGSLFLDKFDRKPALTVAIIGLVIATALGGFATGMSTLLAARIAAGAFGGPATSLSLAIVTDAVPPHRRGKALGAVMAAFSVASVLGVPAGLELARLFGWRTPFFAVAALGLVIAFLATRLLPSMRAHLETRYLASGKSWLDKTTLISLSTTAVIMLGVFAVVPNISTYVQNNLGFPRSQVALLYLVGGSVSFITMRLVGMMVDRFGPVLMMVIGSIFHIVSLTVAFIYPQHALPVIAIFTVYMLSGSARMVPMQTLATKVPRPEQRARFMSAQSAVQHLASAIGAAGASIYLTATPEGALVGMKEIAIGALLCALWAPIGAKWLQESLKRR